MGMSRSTGRVSKADTKAIIIPFDEVLAELESLQTKAPEGFTTAEMSQATGFSPVVCRKKMKLLIEQGRLKCVGRKNIIALDGVARPVPVYRVIENEKS